MDRRDKMEVILGFILMVILVVIAVLAAFGINILDTSTW